MSTTTQVQAIELDAIHPVGDSHTVSTSKLDLGVGVSAQEGREEGDAPSSFHADPEVPPTAVEAIPDGGYGWVVVFACFLNNVFLNGWYGSWGVLQTALLQTHLGATTSTFALSFVGSLGIALCVALGVVSNRLLQLIGSKWASLLGIILLSASPLLASVTTNNLGGLFVTAGVLSGIGGSLIYTLTNNLPVQWFSGKLGLSNGLIKFGGGVGSAVWAVGFEALIERVGISWALRIFGLVTLVAGTLASMLIKERSPSRRTIVLDFSVFRGVPFIVLFFAGAIEVFSLYVPSYFLPLFAHSIGLTTSTGAALVAAFQVCVAIGRVGSGYACDLVGATNTLLVATATNAISMLAIWPVSDTLGLLALFAALNGLANGAFFVSYPMVIAKNVEPGQAPAGMSLAITGWTPGYLLGSPIAGALIGLTGAEKSSSIEPYRAAIFYAGGVAAVSTVCVMFARLRLDRKLIKKL